MSSARIPPQSPSDLNESQLAYYHYLDSSFSETWGKSFKIKDAQNRFIGPFGATLTTPSLGKPFYELAKALGTYSPLSPVVRETAILTVAAHFGAEYALYAHERLALETGVSRDVIEALKRGEELSGVDSEAKLLREVASTLVKGSRPLGRELWERAVGTFGREGAIAIVHFVGLYAYTCVMLNGFGVGGVEEGGELVAESG